MSLPTASPLLHAAAEVLLQWKATWQYNAVVAAVVDKGARAWAGDRPCNGAKSWAGIACYKGRVIEL